MINLESSPNRFRLSALQSTSGSDPDTLTFGPTAWRNNLNGYFRVIFTSANAVSYTHLTLPTILLV